MIPLYFWYDGVYKKVEGQKVKVLFLDCFVMRHIDETAPDWGKWLCIEPMTGLIVSRGDSKERAIHNAKYLIDRYGEKYVLEHVLEGIAEHGGSPDYKEGYTTELKAIKDRLKELNKEGKKESNSQEVVKAVKETPTKKESKMTEEVKIEETKVEAEPKKKRGRPKKETIATPNEEKKTAYEVVELKKKRGRPKKNV